MLGWKADVAELDSISQKLLFSFLYPACSNFVWLPCAGRKAELKLAALDAPGHLHSMLPAPSAKTLLGQSMYVYLSVYFSYMGNKIELAKILWSK